MIATQNDPSIRKARLSAIYQWLESGAITPHVCRRYPLEAYAEAMKAKWNGEFVGGGVLEMGPAS